MWGCIGLQGLCLPVLYVPSLYVRVYRGDIDDRQGGGRSLIICEGVSTYNQHRFRRIRFPHYMWGCIGLILKHKLHWTVPSLYVRVYRDNSARTWQGECSLIICEGVSQACNYQRRPSKFPHYMWGCIVLVLSAYHQNAVPSLYVRVYRELNLPLIQNDRSLIICEGVSELKGINNAIRQFPHYMWGCIMTIALRFAPASVPSLYVRVYRT